MNIMMFLHNGCLNRGCEAIVRSGANIITQRMNYANVNVASFRPSTDVIIPKINNIYDGNSKKIKRYTIPWFISAVRIKLFNDESYAWRKINDNIIKHIDENDICLSVGGDAYCYGEQDGWYEIDRIIKKKGKKLVLWGCSIGEEDMSENKMKDLKRFDLILARESLTYDMLKERGFKNVKLCADGAFTMEKKELPLPKGWKEGNTIGLNFSPLVLNRNEKSGKVIKEFIKYILENTDMTICLTPHVTEENNDDYELLYNYYKEFKNTNRVIILPNDLNATEYKGYISRMRFFIGARTHATIAAYSTYVPTMVLGYSVKSRGISKDIFGEQKLVLGIEEISDIERLKNNFEEMKREEKEIINKLKKSIPKIKEMSYKAGDYLAELVEG